MIDSTLLEILCCPETHQSVVLAETALIDALNRQITAGTIRNRGGQPVPETMDGGLIRADQRFLYPVRSGIPMMLIDEAIPLQSGESTRFPDHASGS